MVRAAVRMRHTWALAIPSLAWALGCDPGTPPPGEKPDSATPTGAVLVVVDTLRADHLGAYGYERATSPRIDAFAKDAVHFENALSTAPWTLPALASLMTSLHPSVHGARTMSNATLRTRAPERFRPTSVLGEAHTTLAEVLRDAGFATAAFVQGAYASADFGLSQGFGVFSDGRGTGARSDVEALLRWLDTERPDRFLVYLHLMDVHAPYGPAGLDPEAPAEEAERLRALDFAAPYEGAVDGSRASLRRLHRAPGQASEADVAHLVALYDQGVAYADHWFGQLLDGLAQRGLYDTSAIVLTSDHGEEFREHGRFEHSRTYYEEVLRVPLLIRDPTGGRGLRVETPVGLVDVLPTLLDVLNVAPPPGLLVQGRSLAAALHGGSLSEAPVFAEAAVSEPGFALRNGAYKYVRTQERELLFDLRADPQERTNVCEQRPDACAEQRRTLRAWQSRMRRDATQRGDPPPKPARVDAETRKALEALGYAEPEPQTAP